MKRTIRATKTKKTIERLAVERELGTKLANKHVRRLLNPNYRFPIKLPTFVIVRRRLLDASMFDVIYHNEIWQQTHHDIVHAQEGKNFGRRRLAWMALGIGLGIIKTEHIGCVTIPNYLLTQRK